MTTTMQLKNFLFFEQLPLKKEKIMVMHIIYEITHI